MWTKKYTPFNLDGHCINKKKKEEFVHLCSQQPQLKILFLQGPSGCGKNSLIDCFGEQYNYEVVRYTHEKSKSLVDVFGNNNSQEEEDEIEKYAYPEDLEKMLFYIKTNNLSGLDKIGSI